MNGPWRLVLVRWRAVSVVVSKEHAHKLYARYSGDAMAQTVRDHIPTRFMKAFTKNGLASRMRPIRFFMPGRCPDCAQRPFPIPAAVARSVAR